MSPGDGVVTIQHPTTTIKPESSLTPVFASVNHYVFFVRRSFLHSRRYHDPLAAA